MYFRIDRSIDRYIGRFASTIRQQMLFVLLSIIQVHIPTGSPNVVQVYECWAVEKLTSLASDDCTTGYCPKLCPNEIK